MVVRRLPEMWRPRPEETRPVPGPLKGAAPLFLGGVVVGLAYGVLSVFVPVARIAAAPGRAGMFFFVYFAGLIGVRLAGGLGLGWLARPRALLPAYGMMAAGLAALPLGNSFVLLVSVGLVCGASPPHVGATPRANQTAELPWWGETVTGSCVIFVLGCEASTWAPPSRARIGRSCSAS